MLTDSSLFRMLFTNTEQTYKPKFRLFSTFRCAVRDFLATYSLQCLPNHPQKLFTERAIACDCLLYHALRYIKNSSTSRQILGGPSEDRAS